MTARAPRLTLRLSWAPVGLVLAAAWTVLTVALAIRQWLRAPGSWAFPVLLLAAIIIGGWALLSAYRRVHRVTLSDPTTLTVSSLRGHRQIDLSAITEVREVETIVHSPVGEWLLVPWPVILWTNTYRRSIDLVSDTGVTYVIRGSRITRATLDSFARDLSRRLTGRPPGRRSEQVSLVESLREQPRESVLNPDVGHGGPGPLAGALVAGAAIVLMTLTAPLHLLNSPTYSSPRATAADVSPAYAPLDAATAGAQSPSMVTTTVDSSRCHVREGWFWGNSPELTRLRVSAETPRGDRSMGQLADFLFAIGADPPYITGDWRLTSINGTDVPTVGVRILEDNVRVTLTTAACIEAEGLDELAAELKGSATMTLAWILESAR